MSRNLLCLKKKAPNEIMINLSLLTDAVGIIIILRATEGDMASSIVPDLMDWINGPFVSSAGIMQYSDPKCQRL